MSADPLHPLVRLRTPTVPSRRAPLARRLARGALASAWALRNPREPLAPRPRPQLTEPRWVRAEDGWECPLRRLPPRLGAPGEPVILAGGLGQTLHTFDPEPDESLAARLHEAGFDVWWLGHRGSSGARPPEHPGPCDLDAIVDQDLPAVIERVKAVTGASRVLWVGHGLGGQLAYAHLASGGDDIAGLVALGAPLLFPRVHTRARLAGRIAAALPSEWRLPLGAVADALAPGPGADLIQRLAPSCDPAHRRGLLLHGTAAVRLGLIRQTARWYELGHLSDRSGRLDYAAASCHVRCPMLLITAEHDPVCPPHAVSPLAGATDHRERRHLNLTGDWGHTDLLVGPRAPEEVHRPITSWLVSRRRLAWKGPSHGPLGN